MRIAWFCIPAYGHTNPTLELVKALTGAGHHIWYFSFEMFREKIENAGAVFIPCDGYDFEMEDKENADRVGKDPAFAAELLVSSTTTFAFNRYSAGYMKHGICEPEQGVLSQLHQCSWENGLSGHSVDGDQHGSV